MGSGVDREESGGRWPVGGSAADGVARAEVDRAESDRAEVDRAESGIEGASDLSGRLSPDALRRLRLGEGTAQDQFLPARERVAVMTVVPRYSRLRGGPTAFGPIGRVVATALVVGGVLWMRAAAGPLGLLVMVVLVPVAALVVRDIWHRERQVAPITWLGSSPAGPAITRAVGAPTDRPPRPGSPPQ